MWGDHLAYLVTRTRCRYAQRCSSTTGVGQTRPLRESADERQECRRSIDLWRANASNALQRKAIALMATGMTPEERSLRARIAAHESWAHTPDPSARTAAARSKFMDRFEREVDPDGVLKPEERARRAEHARRAYFCRLALKSARTRRRRANGGD